MRAHRELWCETQCDTNGVRETQCDTYGVRETQCDTHGVLGRVRLELGNNLCSKEQPALHSCPGQWGVPIPGGIR